MENMLLKAIKIAEKYHHDQVDKAGMPYIGHLMRVMEMGKTEYEKIVGVLHDILEDTEITVDDLHEAGFDSLVTTAIECLTKKKSEKYDDYIDRIKENKLAVRVKLNDLTDNMDIKRLSEITEKDIIRLQKYLKTYHKLLKRYEVYR